MPSIRVVEHGVVDAWPKNLAPCSSSLERFWKQQSVFRGHPYTTALGAQTGAKGELEPREGGPVRIQT